MKNLKQRQSGQTLLIIVLLSTVLVTVGLSLSRITTEEQRLTKLEQESKKAYAAAEAGLEAALRSSTDISIPSLGLGSDITGTAAIQTTTAATFTTPLIKKDDQFTFYLSTFDPALNKVTGSIYSGDTTIQRVTPAGGSYCNTSATQFAVEATFINLSNNTIAGRRLIDECNLIPGTTDETSFGAAINIPSHVLILRVIAPDAAFSGATLSVAAGTGNWPLQGKTIVSQAQTTVGATKKIQLYQSYPQLPAEFFVTSF